MTKKIFLWGFQGEGLGVLKALEAIKAMQDFKAAKTMKFKKAAKAAALFYKKTPAAGSGFSITFFILIFPEYALF
jgi:hypothetical protein